MEFKGEKLEAGHSVKHQHTHRTLNSCQVLFDILGVKELPPVRLQRHVFIKNSFENAVAETWKISL
jgi:hypothetical protein